MDNEIFHIFVVPWRLTGGKLPNEGIVEVYYNGTWGTICATFWDIKDAKVACRSMGLPQATYVIRNMLLIRHRKSWMTRLRCLGNESNLAECPHAGWGNTPRWCTLSYYNAGVVCGYPPGRTVLKAVLKYIGPIHC
jgi:hypothetical protein